jgi:hypothetical protein
MHILGMSSDTNVKEVKVALSPLDEKAFSRTSTRRRRTTRKAAEEQVGGSEPAPVIEKDPVSSPPPQAPVAPTPSSQTSATPTSVPQTPVVPTPSSQPSATTTSVPQPSATPTPAPVILPKPVVGGGQKVKIAAKKGGQTLKAAPSASAAKLLPKKRISAAAPAATLKKPRIPIKHPQNSTSPRKGGAILHVPTVPSAPSAPSAPLEPPKPVLSTTTAVGGAGPTKKRRFTERRIKIDLKQAATTRKQRSFVKSKIASMPIATVKKMLIRKGLLKSKGATPPEDMMRNMLKDYYMLHAAE